MNILQNLSPQLRVDVESELNRWQKENKLKRLWDGDATLWTNTDEAKWIGWLNVIGEEKNEVPRIEALLKDIKALKYSDVVVLGMGGSSLCPDLMAITFGKMANHPTLHVLDSTDPLQIKRLEDKIDLTKTIFIVSSKSGSTLEPNIFKDYFYSRLQQVLNTQAVGDRFVAITDPGSALEKVAKSDLFREVFHGVPSIGGRYSALSNFGMVPSTLMGVDANVFLQYADEMRGSCLPGVALEQNPGVLLGVILGICANQGKDKITLMASKGIYTLGAWLEQLIAESTGKLGKGMIPIDQEPLANVESYGNDRVFIAIRLENESDPEQDTLLTALKAANHVVVYLKVPTKMHLGAEFFRWEMAIAVAGCVMGINPFNQPDVEGSKLLAVKIITEYQKSKKLPSPELLYSEDGLKLLSDNKNIDEIKEKLDGKPTLENYLRAHFNRLKQGDYVNLSAFLDRSDNNTDLLQRCRALIVEKKKVATCLGFGPRFLHSTGQDYKGGPNTGVFLQITADYPDEIPIAGTQMSFGVVISAQAEADLEVLVERSRRVLRVHLSNEADSKKLCTIIERALKY